MRTFAVGEHSEHHGQHKVLHHPAIVETADTTVVVHPKVKLRVDALGNFELSFA